MILWFSKNLLAFQYSILRVQIENPLVILPLISVFSFTCDYKEQHLFLQQLMVPELEKPRVTELHVRMDCNGCVQKIKRAIHNIEGVYYIDIDVPQQKLMVVGRADPDKIVKAIKKTRRIATICSHTEAGEPSSSDQPPAEQTENNNKPETDAANQPPSEAPAEATKEAPAPENPAPEVKAPPESTDAATTQPSGTPETKNAEEIHMIHHYPHHYGFRDHWNSHPNNSYGTRYEAPYYATHSYSSYRPSAGRQEYGYLRSPPQNVRYNGEEPYSDAYYHTPSNGDGNVTSMFSDENPNACRIA